MDLFHLKQLQNVKGLGEFIYQGKRWLFVINNSVCRVIAFETEESVSITNVTAGNTVSKFLEGRVFKKLNSQNFWAWVHSHEMCKECRGLGTCLCSDCDGTENIECNDCCGSGAGDNCLSCKGTGQFACECDNGRIRCYGCDGAEPGKIGEYVINLQLIKNLSLDFFDEISVPAADAYQPLIFRGDKVIAIVMFMRGQENFRTYQGL